MSKTTPEQVAHPDPDIAHDTITFSKTSDVQTLIFSDEDVGTTQGNVNELQQYETDLHMHSTDGAGEPVSTSHFAFVVGDQGTRM